MKRLLGVASFCGWLGMSVIAASFQGCATAEKVAWIAGGGTAPLTIVDTQKHFASFEPTGQNSARLRTDFTLRETREPLGVDVRICSPSDPANLGLELGKSEYGLALYYMAGRKGEFIPNGQYARCKTDQGVRTCARMDSALELSLCFNPSWQDDLKTKGEAVEVLPARVDLVWSCSTGLGYCSWTQAGKLLSDARFILKKIEHKDDVVANAFKERGRWKEAGFSDSVAKKWIEAGFSVEDALQWGKEMDPGEAVKWKAQGWPAAEGKDWWAKTRSMEKAIECKKASFTSSECAEWGDLPPAAAVRWRAAGFSGEEAIVWTEDGVTDPARAKKGLKKGCRDAAKTLDQDVMAAVAISNYTGQQLTQGQLSGLCKRLGTCVRCYGRGKCGGSIPILFGDEKGFINTCLSLDKTFKDSLSLPK